MELSLRRIIISVEHLFFLRTARKQHSRSGSSYAVAWQRRGNRVEWSAPEGTDRSVRCTPECRLAAVLFYFYPSFRFPLVQGEASKRMLLQ